MRLIRLYMAAGAAYEHADGVHHLGETAIHNEKSFKNQEIIYMFLFSEGNFLNSLENAFSDKIPVYLLALILGIVLAVFVLIIILIHNSQKNREDLSDADEMEGTEFEEYCATLLEKNGFTEIELTKKSSDFGVDIFAEKDHVTYAFQCKRYDHPVGTKAVQEIYAGRDFYHCMIGVVISNQYYTKGAQRLAEAFNILLWDRDMLRELENLE